MKEYTFFLITGVLIVMNMVGFLTMGIDKQRAIKKEWRIKERTLLLIAFLGGGIGSLIGMKVFRHKTKHVKFTLLIPIAAVLTIFLWYQINSLRF